MRWSRRSPRARRGSQTSVLHLSWIRVGAPLARRRLLSRAISALGLVLSIAAAGRQELVAIYSNNHASFCS